MVRRNIQASVFLQILSLAIMISAWKAYGLFSSSVNGPAPGFFPFCMGGLLLVLATTLLIVNWRKRNTKEDVPVKEDDKLLKNPRMLLVCFGAFLAGAIVIEWIGFIITMFFVMLIYCKQIDGSTPWWKAILFSAVSSVAAYYLFTYLLQVRLPKGVLPL